MRVGQFEGYLIRIMFVLSLKHCLLKGSVLNVCVPCVSASTPQGTGGEGIYTHLVLPRPRRVGELTEQVWRLETSVK